jgi:hypothetical protein
MVADIVTPAATLACNGQAGQPKPGFERNVTLGTQAVQGLLSFLTKGLPIPGIAAFLGGKSYDLQNVCGSPQPGQPDMSAQDWTDALDYGNPALFLPAQEKAQQWLLNAMWPSWCDCTDGTSPPPSAPVGPPGGSNDPGLDPRTIGGGCWTQSGMKSSDQPNAPIDWTSLLPVIAPPTPVGSPPSVGVQSPLPSSVTLTASCDNSGSTPVDQTVYMDFFNAGGTAITGSQITVQCTPGAPAVTKNGAVPATAASWNLGSFASEGGSVIATNTVSLSFTIYCQGQSPTSLNAPCCPPDEITDQKLGAIMDMLTQLLSLQALAGPYQDAASHSGLTGQGTISINPASSAIRFDVTSDLSGWPHNPQTPNYYYSLGFVTPFAVGTPLRGQRLIYNHQIFSWPSYTDQIGYTFPVGITANLVELTQGA